MIVKLLTEHHMEFLNSKGGFRGMSESTLVTKIVSEYDQEIPQSQTADNPLAPRGRAAQPPRNTRKTSKANSSLFPIKMIAILEWT